jgi:hypothetical protein
MGPNPMLGIKTPMLGFEVEGSRQKKNLPYAGEILP